MPLIQQLRGWWQRRHFHQQLQTHNQHFASALNAQSQQSVSSLFALFDGWVSDNDGVYGFLLLAAMSGPEHQHAKTRALCSQFDQVLLDHATDQLDLSAAQAATLLMLMKGALVSKLVAGKADSLKTAEQTALAVSAHPP